MRRGISLFGLALAVVVAVAAEAGADVLISNPGPGGLFQGATDGTLGFDFTVGASPIEVTALGLWDAHGDGFVRAHEVGLWNAGGTLLGEVNIPAGTVVPLDNGFRFVQLSTPVTLPAQTQYVMGAHFGMLDGDELVLNVGGNQAGFSSAVNSGNVRIAINAGFAFPGTSVGGGSEVGPNALFSVVPEPGTCGLLATGGLVLTGRRRR